MRSVPFAADLAAAASIVPGGDDRAAWFDAHQRQMRACTRCVAAGYLVEANPVFQGHAGQRHMLIGQAPGERGHQRQQPWMGPSGRVLTAWMAAAGFPEESWRDEWYLTSVTKCFPGKQPGANGDRAPSGAEVALCADHLATEIAAVRPEVIATLGRLAVTRVLPGSSKLSLAELVGSRHVVTMPHGEVTVIPLPHPSGVSRWLNDAANRARVEVALGVLAEVKGTA